MNLEAVAINPQPFVRIAQDEAADAIPLQNTFEKPVAGIHFLYAVRVPDSCRGSCGYK